MTSKEGEVNALAAVERLEAKTVNERSQGLEALRQIFGPDRTYYRIDELADDTFHNILEKVFQIVRSEKPKYVRATSKASQSTSSSRLVSAASAIRVIIEAIGNRLKQKTASAVLDHIIDTLPDVEGGFCTPIQTEYLKSFSILLSNGSRGEHFRRKQWFTYVDFVVDHLNEGLGSGSDAEASTPSQQQLADSRTGVSMSLRISQASAGKRQQVPTGRREELLLEELLTALKLLTSITNAPIAQRLDQILSTTVFWLDKMPRAEECAFEVLNYTVPIALSEDIVLAAKTFNDIAQIIRQRGLWAKKSISLRENMLATMTLCQNLFSNVAWDVQLVTASTLEQLLAIMQSEYERQSERDRLQVEDLGFSHPSNATPFSLNGIYLVSEMSRTINTWSTLSTMACLLVEIAKKRFNTEHRKDEEMVSKRRKLQDPIHDLFKIATTLGARNQLVSLQLCLFVVEQDKSIPDAAACLSQLHLTDLEDEPTVASWTCLLLARIAFAERLQQNFQPDFWRKIWLWACRASTAAATSRSACYLLYSIIQLSTIRPILSSQAVHEGIFADGISGPNALTDAALLLLISVLGSGLLDTEKICKLFASQALRWFDYQWTISSVPDRQHNAQIAFFAKPDLTYQLLMLLAGVQVQLKSSPAPLPASNIRKAILYVSKDVPFTKHMSCDAVLPPSQIQSLETVQKTRFPSSSISFHLRQAIVELLINKTKTFYATCKGSVEEQSGLVNLDIMEIASTACILCHLVARVFASDQDWLALEAVVKPLWHIIYSFLLNQSKENFPKAFSRITARSTSIQLIDASAQGQLTLARSELQHHLVEVLDQSFESQVRFTPVLDQEFMESSDIRPSQSSQLRSTQTANDIERADVAVSSNFYTLVVRQRFILKLDQARARANLDPDLTFGGAAIELVLSLEPEELLATKDLIVGFMDSETMLSRIDSFRLLTRLAKVCLLDVELERCEAALCLCLRVATQLTPLWATEQEDDLANVAYDIYKWYIEIALGKGIASQQVLLSMAGLLDRILQCNPSYGTDSLPSARTSLLQILRTAQTGLKYHLMDYLSNLFNRYVLSEHSAVFDDIIENLPSDPDRREGIHLRLYIIACLGARWHTILRQSVYYIIETAANVPSTSTSAAKCLEMICIQLKLNSPQQLLKLFSPQVFYTWLESQEINSIPHAAFGFNNLKAFQANFQGELVPQIAMRGSADQIQEVVQSLGISWDSLLERWFAKTVAYAMLTDITIHRSSREIGKAEMSLVQYLGEDTYSSLCRKCFVNAVSIVLLRLSDDRGFEKAQSQESNEDSYAVTYRLICARSSSQMQLPPGQQPSFRAKHLVQILDRICMRAQETLEGIWTPALLIHVYRALLADAKPAFGPLHSCAILRKIRVVVCLAGPVALHGYPLQMLLHALRPFLTQFHSSEDAFGIFWYLLDYGRDYLKQKLPFVTGLSVAIFASLSKFASSSQESTTQESHFTSTMTKAQEFRAWLGEYLQEFSAPDLSGMASSTFTEVVRAAKQITKPGNSAQTTSEGMLIYHLLADQASEQPLLSNIFFRLTLRSLCDNFTPAADLQDDILYNDDDVLNIAPVLLSILRHEYWQDEFRIWISQALGRAYALQGPTLMELDSSSYSNVATCSNSDVAVEDSYQSIINIVGDLLWDENGTFASAAEATLQSIFSALPVDNKAMVVGTNIGQSMFDELRFVDLPCPSIANGNTDTSVNPGRTEDTNDSSKWSSNILKTLCNQQKADPVLSFLPALMDMVPSVAATIFPHVVHLALYFEIDQPLNTKEFLTETFSRVFDAKESFSKSHVQLALNSVAHLRRCVLPLESTMAKRNSWLTIDFGAAAIAALRYKMYRMALLMLEIHVSQYNLTASRSSRKSAQGDMSLVPDISSQIYQHVDDPDFFYGTHEESDVASIVEKLCHEGHGYKALSFQSALFDSNIRSRGMNFALGASGGTTVSALNLANLNGLSSSIGSFVTTEHQENILEHSLQSILNLHQWDIAHDQAISDHGIAIVSALKTLSSAFDRQNIVAATNQGTLKVAQLLLGNLHQRTHQISHWTSLAALAELKEVISATGPDDLEVLLQKRSARRAWTEQESFEYVEPLLLSREAIFATITNNPQVRILMGVSAPQAILLEIKTLRASLSLGHVHEMSQFCLNRAAYLSKLLPSATDLGVKVEAAIQYDLANTFWAQQETAAAIRILQNLHEQVLPNQAIEVQQAEILTDLGSKITEARLDRPDEVTAKYLVPAIEALGGETMGSKVGRVFHNFAAFCDSQLREPDNVDEYERVEKIRNRKMQEVVELETMYKRGDSKTRDTVKAHYNKAKTWFKLDDEELQRLKAHRERLVRSCLENYLLSLRACQDYPNDVLRFLALWMEQSVSPSANTSVKKYLSSVPTYKFAPLMNQLSSRALSEETPFQHLLSDLMYHICEDHPFHSLYQLFATSKSKGAQKDEVANSRHAAATKLSEKVMKKSSASNLWISVHNSNIQFVRVAQEKFPDKEFKTGSKLLLRKLTQGAKLEQTMHDMHHKIPPPTMKLDIRPDKDYSSVPTIAKFDPQISIAGGVSAPKVLTAIATDGSQHKMLLKYGNDDLRQDSIMEQVFEQVSNLLKDHRATRQRKLGIRTYKVIPLTHNSGIIEFVQDTMPLHDYVLPAHTRYYPKDFKPNKCRKDIADAQSKSLNQRLQAYRNVVSNFHPVMRFFFMEHFLDPDDWFQKRLNYSRSTAAISMLGHVLGLGDRHGHNILLDTKTGEAVHIDLGVAFEAGRVLPVPEVVPFRLTRDLVDGMGLSGVEGVFRRCCNFTLEALRRNQEAIMTILDVLRWDPLYSWSVSPLRLARMQENQEQAANASTAASTSDVGASTTADVDVVSKRNANEPSEADRALAVVSKKLGKSLSVEATVNELIRQAMDERNLAVLYCGWAAYA